MKKKKTNNCRKTKLMTLLCVVVMSRHLLAPHTDVDPMSAGDVTNEDFAFSKKKAEEGLIDRGIARALTDEGIALVNEVIDGGIQPGSRAEVVARSVFHAGSPDVCQIEYLVTKYKNRNGNNGYMGFQFIDLDGYNPNDPDHRRKMEEFLVTFRDAEENRESYNKFLALIDSYDEPLTLAKLLRAGITKIQLVMFSLLGALDLILGRTAPVNLLSRLMYEDREGFTEFTAILEQTLGRKGMLHFHEILSYLIRGDHSLKVTELIGGDWNCISADSRTSLLVALIRAGQIDYVRRTIENNYQWFPAEGCEYESLLDALVYGGQRDLAEQIINKDRNLFFRQEGYNSILLALIEKESDAYVAELLKNDAVKQGMLLQGDDKLVTVLAELVRTGKEDNIEAVMEIMKRFDNRLMDRHDAETLLYYLIEAGKHLCVEEVISSMKDQNILGRLFRKLISSRIRGEISHVAAFLERNVEMYVKIITKDPSDVLTRVLEEIELARKVAEELAKANREVWGETTTKLLHHMTFLIHGDLIKQVIDSNRSGFIGSNGADDVLERLVESHPDYVKELIEDNLQLFMEQNNVECILGKLFGKEHADFVANIRKAMEELSHPAQAEQFAV